MDRSSNPSSTAPAGQRRQRVYQQWQGNERFFCGGRCVAGPNWKSLMGSLALLVAPSVVFIAWVATYMGQRVSWAILGVSCVMPVLSLAWLLLTACRDPGILPRQEPDEEWLQGRKPRTKDVIVNGQRVQVRYNDTCHFYQPPRAHHCSVNDNCIERFDHHCPWVGTTIGLRNYRTFLLFVYTTTLYIAWVLAVSVWSLFLKHGELEADALAKGAPTDGLWLQVPGQAVPSIVLIAYAFLFLWFVGGLSGFHSYLVATNQTTYENFRFNHSAAPNPYNLGVVKNCASVWCIKVPPSKVDFRAFVGEGRALGNGKPSHPSARLASPAPSGGEAVPPALVAAGGAAALSGSGGGGRRGFKGSGLQPGVGGGLHGCELVDPGPPSSSSSSDSGWAEATSGGGGDGKGGAAPEHVQIEMTGGQKGV